MTERTALGAGIDFIVPVWGASYTRLFVDVCLPTLLAPGNIPALPYPDRHVFAIYTTPDDRRTIEAAPAFRRLAGAIRVEFHPVRARVAQIINHYDVQSDCFRRAIRRADAADRALVFLTPDLIMADGSLRGLARIAGTPVRAVLGVGIRLDKAPVSRHVLANHCSAAGDVIAIAPRDLVRLALDALHPIAKAHMFHAESDQLQLSNLYWRVGGEGLLARCFHLHPFLVYPRVKNAPFTNTVDGDYLESACPDPADTYVLTDSDEFSAWELSDADRRVPALPRSAPLADLVKWVRDKTTPRHRALIGNAIRIHCGMTDQTVWQRTELEAADAVAKLLAFAEQDAQPAAVARSASPLHFMTALRSLDEARAFVEIALPSALAPGNIPRLPNRPRSLYTIVAAPACAPLIEAAPAIAELREHVPTDVRVVPEAAAADPGFVAACRIETLRDAVAREAAAIFIDPDVVLSGTSLDSALRICDLGARAVVAPCLRLVADTAVPVLLRDFKVEGLLSIASEALIRLAMAHLHPASESQLWAEGRDPVDPGALLWRVENEGFVMQAFALDPFLVRPRQPPRTASHLHDLLVGSGLREEEIGLFHESAPFVQCRLSARATVLPATRRRDLVAWAAANTTPFQRLMFRSVVRLSAVGTRGARWQAVEAMAATEALQVLAAIDAAPRPSEKN